MFSIMIEYEKKSKIETRILLHFACSSFFMLVLHPFWLVAQSHFSIWFCRYRTTSQFTTNKNILLCSPLPMLPSLTILVLSSSSSSCSVHHSRNDSISLYLFISFSLTSILFVVCTHNSPFRIYLVRVKESRKHFRVFFVHLPIAIDNVSSMRIFATSEKTHQFTIE